MDKGQKIISSVSGFVIGLLSGLVGIGGGEYRGPVLIYLLRLDTRVAIATNLLVGLIAVSVSFASRVSADFTGTLFTICIVMSVASVIGSRYGSHLTKKINEKHLKKCFGILLLIAGVKVFLESGDHAQQIFQFNTITMIAIALVSGFLISIICGLLGVAGGEFRIPLLMFAFGLPIKLAGTASLLVSIPTVLSGFIKHRHLGHVNKASIAIALFMGAFSIVGSLIGAALLFSVPAGLLTKILGVIMLSVSVKMIFWS